MGGDDLDELAARGRAALERERLAQRAALEARDRESVVRAYLSCTQLGVLRTYVGGLLVGAATLVVCMISFGWSAVADNPSPTAGAIALLALAFALPVAAIVLARRAALVAGRAAYPRVLAWAASLPFPVERLAEVLAASPERALVIDIDLTPPADLGRAALAAIGLGHKHLTAHVTHDGVRITQGHLGVDDDAGAQAPETNYPVVQTLRWLVPNLLAPLHAQTPIRSIRLSLSSDR